MDCELCGEKDPSTVVILPISRENGMLNTLSCLACAEKSSRYCKRHQRPHLGFVDNKTSACTMCIEEMVLTQSYKQPHIIHKLRSELPEIEYRRLLDFASVGACVFNADIEILIFRYVAIIAIRFGATIEDVVEQIINCKSVSPLIGDYAMLS